MAKRRNKTVYIPVWECSLGVVGCPINNMDTKTCLMCSHNNGRVETRKFEQWMNEYINKSIFLSERSAKEYIERTNADNRKGGMLLNV